MFALTTAIAGVYELIMPVIWVLKNSNPELSVVRGRLLTYLASGIFMFVAAPIFFPLVLVPKMGVAFRHGLHRTFLSNHE